MAMKDDDYRTRDEREMSSRDRENSYRDRDMNRDRTMGSRDWRDDDYRYSQESNRYPPANYGSGNYGQGNYSPGHYNQGGYPQGGYQGAGSYGHGSYGASNGGMYGQGRGQMPRGHYRDGSQTYPNRDWNRDWSVPTDYRSSPYEQDWGRSQWGNSEYGANFRDSSVLGDERTRYGRNHSDFQATGYGTTYASAGDRYNGREQSQGRQPNEHSWERYGREGASDYDTGMYMGREPGWNREGGREWRGEPRHESMMHKVGRFFGIGPKGYKRPDSRIEEEVNDALVDDPFIDATNVEVKVKDAEVTLEGTVDDRMAKRRAEDLAANVRGVKDVHNHLKTVPAGHHQHDIGTITANTGLATEPGKKGPRSNAVS